MNYRGHKKKKAKSKGALEKVPEGTALEKADGTIRRGRRAKHGQVQVLMETTSLATSSISSHGYSAAAAVFSLPMRASCSNHGGHKQTFWIFCKP